MYKVAKLEWSSSGCVYADVSIAIWADNTYFNPGIATYVFNDFVRAASNGFFITVPDNMFADSTLGGPYSPLYVQIGLYPEHKNGDSVPNIDLTNVSILDNTAGQKIISTQHSVVLSMLDGTMTTGHSVFIDRTEYYGDPDSFIFFDSTDASTVSDITNGGYAYDKEPTSTYAIYPEQVSGRLQILRTTDSSYGGVNGYVHIAAKVLNGFYGPTLQAYLDYTDSDIGPYYIGQFFFNNSLDSIKKKSFKIPLKLMDVLSHNRFNKTHLLLKNINDTSTGSSWGIYDSYITFYRTIDSTLDTSHEVLIADSTTPIVNKIISTKHIARITRGSTYELDYYTPGEWWKFTGDKEYYNFVDWNKYENILQYFGRYYHSPIYFKSQLPDFGSLTFRARSNGKLAIVNDNLSAETPTIISKYIDGSSHGVNIISDSAKYLSLYNPKISPEVLTDDGTIFRALPAVQDNTICVYWFYSNDGTYFNWESTNNHPFITNRLFYLSYYCKKG